MMILPSCPDFPARLAPQFSRRRPPVSFSSSNTKRAPAPQNTENEAPATIEANNAAASNDTLGQGEAQTQNQGQALDSSRKKRGQGRWLVMFYPDLAPESSRRLRFRRQDTSVSFLNLRSTTKRAP